MAVGGSGAWPVGYARRLGGRGCADRPGSEADAGDDLGLGAAVEAGDERAGPGDRAWTPGSDSDASWLSFVSHTSVTQMASASATSFAMT